MATETLLRIDPGKGKEFAASLIAKATDQRVIEEISRGMKKAEGKQGSF